MKTGEGGFGGLSPPKTAPIPHNWNMKHYKLVEFLLNLNVKPPLHERKAPPHKCNDPQWWLSGDGSDLRFGKNAVTMPYRFTAHWKYNIQYNRLKPYSFKQVFLTCQSKLTLHCRQYRSVQASKEKKDNEYTRWEQDYDLQTFRQMGLLYEYLEMGEYVWNRCNVHKAGTRCQKPF